MHIDLIIPYWIVYSFLTGFAIYGMLEVILTVLKLIIWWRTR